MRPMRYPSMAGFTLLELVFVVGIMAILSATVLTTFLCLNRAATAVTAHRSAQAGARHALAAISDDVRQARTVSASAQGSDLLTVQKADASSPVRYVLDGGVLTRRNGDSARVLCAGVAGMRVDLMTREGKPASDAGSVALVRTTLDIIEARRGPCSSNTFSLATARRNGGSP